nr:hypothetical protein [Mycolicibacterium hodleri]
MFSTALEVKVPALRNTPVSVPNASRASAIRRAVSVKDAELARTTRISPGSFARAAATD